MILLRFGGDRTRLIRALTRRPAARTFARAPRFFRARSEEVELEADQPAALRQPALVVDGGVGEVVHRRARLDAVERTRRPSEREHLREPGVDEGPARQLRVGAGVG